jgi:Chalcone isomerase-like
MRWHRLTLLITVFLVVCGRLGAEELPAPLKEHKPELTLRGSTTLHWFGIHVYNVALYTEGVPYTTNSTAVLSLRYEISIKHKKLQETTLEEWKRLGKGTPEQREKWISQLDKIWPDIKSGESLSAFLKKDGPTTFYFGDRLLGEVTDVEFGPAFFAIWLDAKCRYPKVRKGLLKEEEVEKKGK